MHKNLVKIGHVIPEISVWTDRQTDSQTDTHTYTRTHTDALITILRSPIQEWSNKKIPRETIYLSLLFANVYLADEKMMIAIATVVRAAATTPLIISTASNVFSPPIPEQQNCYRCFARMTRLNVMLVTNTTLLMYIS